MKRICLLPLAVVSARFASAQNTWGTISFYNRNIPIPGGGSIGGANGNGTYNVPVWTDYTRTSGAGALTPAGTIGLFLGSDPDTATPLATQVFRTLNNQQYFAGTVPDIQIPGVLPGETTTLLVRAWQGPSFSSAKPAAPLNTPNGHSQPNRSVV